MAVELNPNSPNPKVTNSLKDLGLEVGIRYKTQWSEDFRLEWDLVVNKEIVLTLPFEKVERLIQAKILISRF